MKNEKLHTRKRTYFFNHFENENENNVIEIIESQIIKKGVTKRNKIIIYEKDLPKFIQKLKKMKDENHSP